MRQSSAVIEQGNVASQPVQPTPQSASASQRPAATASPEAQTTIGSKMLIKGKITAREPLRIDGIVEGAVEAPSHQVTIAPGARVTATVMASHVVILGTMRGNIRATEKIELRSTANLEGDVVTPRIIIEDGACFKGSIDITRPIARALAAKSAEELEQRYTALVETKYLRGLSVAEQQELDGLAEELAQQDAAFYDPILRRLRNGDWPRSAPQQINAGE